MSKIEVDEVVNQTGDNDSGIDLSTNDVVVIKTANTEAMRITADRDVLIAKTAEGVGTAGFEVQNTGKALITVDGDRCLDLNRLTDVGQVFVVKTGGNQRIALGGGGGAGFIDGASGDTGLKFEGLHIRPRDNGADVDNSVDLGNGSFRFDDLHATNGTIQTSDQNEKQDIASATAKELNVAKKLSALFKTFRWKDKVTEKGDKARTHTGIIAQEVQSAFSAEGLDASNYGLFISYTWTNEEGKEQTRLGVRYPELFSFIFSSIEARLTALEGA